MSDYDGTLVARVVAGGKVWAEDTLSDDMTLVEQAVVSARHEAVARRLLARGLLVIVECRNLDGSPFTRMLLAPDGDGFRIVYRKEFSP